MSRRSDRLRVGHHLAVARKRIAALRSGASRKDWKPY
jgi:hypothetical protein